MGDKLAIEGGTPVRSGRLPMGRGLAFLGDEEKAAAIEVLDSRSLFRYYGPDLQNKVEGFERSLAELVGAKHAVGLSSGTAALKAGLAALGIGCGDEVVVPAFTFIATVNAVVSVGAVPIFCEIDYSLGLCPDNLQTKITDKTAAVMPVHLENQGCNMDKILDVAKSRGIAVIEDACQAIGASYKGKGLGTLGDCGAFSLQLEKNITSGEGGALVSNDDELFVRAARFSDQGGQFVTSYGSSRGEELTEPFCGENLRMTEIAGAIAGEQLKKLPSIIESFRTNRRKILDTLGSFDGLELRKSHDPDGDGGSSLTWYVSSQEVALNFIKALRAEGVPCVQVYDGKPVYATPSILAKRTATNKGGPWHCAEHPTDVTYEMGICPETEELVERAFTVGVGPMYSSSDCEDIATAIGKVATHLL
jgi:8-amino-3,8-dideoxy-alpha-D-manno-octulosonate transaminase